MDVSKIKAGSNPEKINAVIEIPYGSNIKYEIDKDSGAVVVETNTLCKLVASSRAA